MEGVAHAWANTTAWCCRHIIATNFFTNASGESRFEIRHRTNCKTKNAIYLGFCLKCIAKQYVGIQGTNKRVNKHLNDVHRPDAIAIDKHFSEPGHDFTRDFRIIVVKRSLKKISQRNRCELYYFEEKTFGFKS